LPRVLPAVMAVIRVLSWARTGFAEMVFLNWWKNSQLLVSDQ
jgi:hypothetical protein